MYGQSLAVRISCAWQTPWLSILLSPVVWSLMLSSLAQGFIAAAMANYVPKYLHTAFRVGYAAVRALHPRASMLVSATAEWHRVGGALSGAVRHQVCHGGNSRRDEEAQHLLTHAHVQAVQHAR